MSYDTMANCGIAVTSRKSKSKSEKTLFKVRQCKQNNVSSHLKWVLVADKHAYDEYDMWA